MAKKYYPELWKNTREITVYIARWKKQIIKQGRADQGLGFTELLEALETAANQFVEDVDLEENI